MELGFLCKSYFMIEINDQHCLELFVSISYDYWTYQINLFAIR